MSKLSRVSGTKDKRHLLFFLIIKISLSNISIDFKNLNLQQFHYSNFWFSIIILIRWIMPIKTVFREPNLQCIDFILRQNIRFAWHKKLLQFSKKYWHTFCFYLDIYRYFKLLNNLLKLLKYNNNIKLFKLYYNFHYINKACRSVDTPSQLVLWLIIILNINLTCLIKWLTRWRVTIIETCDIIPTADYLPLLLKTTRL